MILQLKRFETFTAIKVTTNECFGYYIFGKKRKLQKEVFVFLSF